MITSVLQGHGEEEEEKKLVDFTIPVDNKYIYERKGKYKSILPKR